MTIGKFYGVYSKYRVGIYDDWDKVVVDKHLYWGFKVKRFDTLQEAIEYIKRGLIYDYRLLTFGILDDEALLAAPLNKSIIIREITL